MTKKELITLLIDKSKDEKDGVFIPNEVELKISELPNFDEATAKELSEISASVFTKSFGNGDGIYRKDNFKKSLIEYSVEEDYIKFFPATLKAYLNENKK